MQEGSESTPLSVRLGALALSAVVGLGAVASPPPAVAFESAADRRAAMAERRAELLAKAREGAEAVAAKSEGPKSDAAPAFSLPKFDMPTASGGGEVGC